ncbi:MAG TPA: error-prone DNA polymerase [Casimicrobiaceae bacterium]|nr:error-prone DNA polymerase [Casimicrobiaceae bacterium]
MASPDLLPAYAELHCLSNFSFLRGASHPEELVERAKSEGYAALALTDECSLAGAVRAHLAAKDAGLPLMLGSEFTLDDDVKLVLLATDRASYGDLSQLITRGRRNAGKGTYRLTRDDVAQCASSCLALWLPAIDLRISGIDDALRRDAAWVREVFGDNGWIDVELHAQAGDAARLAQCEALSTFTGLPLVAAGDAHMHVRARRALQDTLTSIRLGVPLSECGHALFPNGERHLRSRARLASVYPSALLEETVRIAKRCHFSLDELRYEYPDEIVPHGETPTTWLRKLVEAGLSERYPKKGPGSNSGRAKESSVAPFSLCGGEPDFLHGDTTFRCTSVPANVRALIDYELALIAELRYEPYFLTVHDIVAFARENKILCQGRGSAANSAVCYALRITEVDPARSEMLFERFISRERNEPPDIDVDFEHQRREAVMQYVYDKYGRHRAALAATLVTYQPKSAVRDVGRAFGLDLAQLDRLSGVFAWWDGRAIHRDRIREAGFDPENPVLRRVIILAGHLLGFPRHLSQHVGGFVIARDCLERMVPVENAAMEKRTVIQWDKDDLDAMGLLKVDCLALGMLSAIRRALEMVSSCRGKTLRMEDIPPEDPAVYAMIQKADTIGVFQIESRAQQSMLPRLRPATFYDLVIEVAIVRPGPIQGGMVHPYLKRRQKLEPVTYPSDAVKSVLERTLGVPIFQEQVMQLAIVAAGFTPGEADRLRRSMAAWKRKGGLQVFEQRLVDGMSERGYDEAFARQIYQQILGFGEYGFPESHAASFALLVYVSSWLKHYEPAAFCAALLNSQPMGFYAPAQLVADARRHEVVVLPPDVTVSEWDCILEDQCQRCISRASVMIHDSRAGKYISGTDFPASGTDFPALRLGLRLVRGLTEAGAKRIVEARQAQRFASVADLAYRAKLDRRDLTALADGDALASLAGHRHDATWDVAGVERLPALLDGATFDEAKPSLPPPTEGEDIVADYRRLGLTLRRHPLALLRSKLRARRLATADDVRAAPHGRLVRTAGIVIGRQRPDTASGVIFVTIEDETGASNIIVRREISERQRRELLGARLLGVYGTIEREGEVVHVLAGRLVDLTSMLGTLQTRSRDFH